MSLCLICTCILTGLVSSFCPLQQFFNSRLILLSTIEPEIQLGRAADSQAFYQFVPNVFLGCLQSLEATTGFSIVSFHVDPDFRRATVISDMNRSHADQPDARISQFALNESFNLFAKGFANPASMMLEPALLQHF